jgi:hypothetical protein
MIVPSAWPRVLDFFRTALVIEPSSGQINGDAKLLPLRQLDQRIGLARAFTQALDDPRGADLNESAILQEFGLDSRQQNGNNIGRVSPK